MLGAAAAAVAALVLVLRSDKAKRAISEIAPGFSAPQHRSAEPKPSEASHEFLAAWVHFLKDDILGAVNALNNRLNVISNTATEARSDENVSELRHALDRIHSESERAAKITTGLFSRVDSFAPDSAPPVVFEFDGSKLPSAHILLVEDDEANRNVLCKVLRRLDQKVTAVTNGFDAFSVLESSGADCIISDIRLPYLDGRTLFEQVEQGLPHLARRFVFVTGDFTNPRTLSFLKQTGQPYVGKPYELDALLGAVAAVLRNRVAGDLEPATRQT